MTWKLKPAEVELAAMKKGMNIADLQRAAGLAQGTIYFAMSGKRNPTLKTIAKIAAALGVEVEQIAERMEG